MADKLRTYQITIFTMLFVGYACYAYNRKSVSLAMPKLMEEGLDKNQAGLIISCQNVAYAISKFLGGILSDRISARVLFSAGLTFCGLVTLVFASSSSVPVFALLWFLNGFGQGCGWPACSKILRQVRHDASAPLRGPFTPTPHCANCVPSHPTAPNQHLLPNTEGLGVDL
ncbi:Glucose-6-phosphate exchanger SLC37A4 [Araneus ventricosus]|uniref:Glucose-6-phosphate exchanger SLC37A4 n=1 Tax=Araneus ventricosus TaxID=182803 RepID=A0A4Y2K5W5_ARAVE|nr:Glucose-6-phosphate exchanger SLC37A4 [Araneus ventricosus]